MQLNGRMKTNKNNKNGTNVVNKTNNTFIAAIIAINAIFCAKFVRFLKRSINQFYTLERFFVKNSKIDPISKYEKLFIFFNNLNTTCWMQRFKF